MHGQEFVQTVDIDRGRSSTVSSDKAARLGAPEPPHRRRPSHAAFSTVEITLVLVCACVLLALAVPALREIHAEWSLWGGAYQVESALQWGRLQAISANKSLAFEVGQEGRSFWWRDAETGGTYQTTVRWLPVGVRIDKQPAQPVRFFPRGNAAPAGSYVLAGGAGAYRVVVNPAGRIRVEKQ